MTYKNMVKKMSYYDLQLTHYHYAIQATFEIYTSIVKDDGEELDVFDEDSFANSVDESDIVGGFSEADIGQIKDLIVAEYTEELNSLNDMIVSNQRRKSWAYLVRFE